MRKGVAYAPEEDGMFFSKFAIDQVMQAKVEAIKR
jgi:hypothetical protein